MHPAINLSSGGCHRRTHCTLFGARLELVVRRLMYHHPVRYLTISSLLPHRQGVPWQFCRYGPIGSRCTSSARTELTTGFAEDDHRSRFWWWTSTIMSIYTERSSVPRRSRGTEEILQDVTCDTKYACGGEARHVGELKCYLQDRDHP